MRRVSYDQYPVISLAGGTSRMDGSFGSENCDAGVCDKRSSGVREIHNPSLFTQKKMEVVLCLEVSYQLSVC